MNLLDDGRALRRIDRDDVWRAFELLPEQARQAWTESRRVKLPSFAKVRRVVVSGMGGSALGPQVIRSVFRDAFRAPVEIVNGYALPGGVGPETLVLLSSYSGGTEETLAAAAEAKKRRAKIVGIGAGGKLAAFLRKAKAPAYVFDAANNPGNRPRLALGYSIFGILGLLVAAKLLPDVSSEAAEAIRALHRAVRRYGRAAPFAGNAAKKLAFCLKDSVPIYVAAEHLEGSAHVLANQTNETGKQFACWFPIPELDHHLLEGLAHPVRAKKSLAFVFLDSALYSPRNRRRFSLTEDVVKKNGVVARVWRSRERTNFAQAAELLAFGGATTYYLGILHRENPSPNPWVDYFKRRLA
jgi:glucose/mannose-6-phosphate isomerase